MTEQINREKLQELVEKLTLEVLAELEPDSVELSSGMVSPLFSEVLRGQLFTVNNHEHAGGFGGADLLVYTVVPLIYNGLTRKEAVLARQEIKKVALQTKSRKARMRLSELEDVLNRVLGKNASKAI